MNLTELQRLADLVDLMPWERPGDVPYAHKKQFQDAMSPDTAKKLIAAAKVVEEAHALVQEFKTRWMALPPFADKINRATREGMTMAHQPIMQAEERLRTALEELK